MFEKKRFLAWERESSASEVGLPVISFRNMWHVGEKYIAACEYLSRFSVFKPPKLLIPKKGLQARCRPRETALKNLGSYGKAALYRVGYRILGDICFGIK